MDEVFKITINKDSKNNDISINNISVEAAESLKLFIDSMTLFCENYTEEEKSQVKFSFDTESLQYITSMNEDIQIREDLDIILTGIKENDFKELNTIENSSEKVKHLRTIQEKIISNGLDYSIFHQNSDNEYVDISKSIKKNRIKYRASYIRDYEVVFIKGSLYEVGGKKATNIHLLDNEIEYKVDTDREQAYKFSEFLYKEVYISALKTTIYKSSLEESYELIDKYLSNETFKSYQEIYSLIQNSNISTKCDIIYEYLENNFKNDQIGNNIKFLRLFNNKHTNKGLLRFLLLSSKNYLKINDSFDEVFYSLSSILNKK